MLYRVSNVKIKNSHNMDGLILEEGGAGGGVWGVGESCFRKTKKKRAQHGLLYYRGGLGGKGGRGGGG